MFTCCLSILNTLLFKLNITAEFAETKPRSGVHAERQAFSAEELFPVNVDPVVHRPAVLAVLVDTTARNPLPVLRQPEVDVDAVVGDILII